MRKIIKTLLFFCLFACASCLQTYTLSQTFSSDCLDFNYPDSWKIIEEEPDTINTFTPTYHLYNPNLKIAMGYTFEEDSLIVIKSLCLPIKSKSKNIFTKDIFKENCKTCKVHYTNSVPYIKIEKNNHMTWIAMKLSKTIGVLIEFRIKKKDKELISEDMIESMISTLKVK